VIIALKDDGKGSMKGRWSQPVNATRTIWNFWKPVWNVREFYFGLVGTLFMHLMVFLHNLSPSPFWSTSWSGTLHFIFHTFLHCLLFATHAHTNATCLAAVPNPSLCLSTRYLELYLVALAEIVAQLLSLILVSQWTAVFRLQLHNTRS